MLGTLARDMAGQRPGSNFIRTLDAAASRTTTASRSVKPFFMTQKSKIAAFTEQSQQQYTVPAAPLLLDLAVGDGART